MTVVKGYEQDIMAISSFGKILTVLDLFSVSRPIINVDIICERTWLVQNQRVTVTLKELVSADLLKRINGTSGDYTLGSKLQFLTIYLEQPTHWFKSARHLCEIL